MPELEAELQYTRLKQESTSASLVDIETTATTATWDEELGKRSLLWTGSSSLEASVFSRCSRSVCLASTALLGAWALALLSATVYLVRNAAVAAPEGDSSSASSGHAGEAHHGSSIFLSYGHAGDIDDRHGGHAAETLGNLRTRTVEGESASKESRSTPTSAAEEETPCLVSEDVSISLPAVLAVAVNLPSWRRCNQWCLNTSGCGVWTWSNQTRLCSAGGEAQDGAVRNHRLGWVSGQPSRACAMEEEEEEAAAGGDSQDSSWLRGVVRSRFGGKCLDAADTQVRLRPCLDGSLRQAWAFDPHGGQLRHNGACLHAAPSSTAGLITSLTLKPCAADGPEEERWSWATDSGHLKTWQGHCMAGSESPDRKSVV